MQSRNATNYDAPRPFAERDALDCRPPGRFGQGRGVVVVMLAGVLVTAIGFMWLAAQ